MVIEKLAKLVRQNLLPQNRAVTFLEITAVFIWMSSTAVFYLILNDVYEGVEIFAVRNVLLYVASYFVVDGLMFGLLFRNLSELAIKIEGRGIDGAILLPGNTINFLSFRSFQLSSLVQIPIALLIVFLFVKMPVVSFILWVVTLVLGFVLAYLLWIDAIFVSFWVKNENKLTMVVEELAQIGVFPMQVYLNSFVIFFFGPFLLISSASAYSVLMGNQGVIWVVQVCAIVVLFLLRQLLFNLGIKRYRR